MEDGKTVRGTQKGLLRIDETLTIYRGWEERKGECRDANRRKKL